MPIRKQIYIIYMTPKYYIYFFSINMTLSTDTSKTYCISFIIDVSKLQLDHTTILRNFTGGTFETKLQNRILLP